MRDPYRDQSGSGPLCTEETALFLDSFRADVRKTVLKTICEDGQFMNASGEGSAWRGAVHRLLRQACDRKLVRGGMQTASEYLERARALLPEQGAETWKAQIEYREAHIAFRQAGLASARGAEDECRRCLERAVGLFQKAAESPCFALLARIYALPACLRLGLFSQGSGEHLRRIREICSMNVPRNGPDVQLQLDANIVNITEISAYYACYWSDALEGRAAPLADRPGSYTILSADPTFERIRMTKAFAWNELNDLVRAGRSELALFLDGGRLIWHGQDPDTPWKEWESRNRTGVLLAMFNTAGRSPSDWFAGHSRNAGDPGNSGNASRTNTFRKYKNDLKNWLAQAGYDVETIFSRERESREVFAETFRLFLAVPADFSERFFF